MDAFQSCYFPVSTLGRSKELEVEVGCGRSKEEVSQEQALPLPFRSLSGSLVALGESRGEEHKIVCETKDLNWIKLVWNFYVLK